MPITILQLAEHRGVKKQPDGSISGSAMVEVSLPMMGGCSVCGAMVAAYNGCPSRSGYLKCLSGCIGSDGYDTAEEANADIFGED